MSPFAAWESFYVILGSSAAALTGLQFVVMVLGAEINAPATVHTTRAFGTPTIVHFCAVLLNSAILSAPWHRVTSASAGCGHGSVGGAPGPAGAASGVEPGALRARRWRAVRACRQAVTGWPPARTATARGNHRASPATCRA